MSESLFSLDLDRLRAPEDPDAIIATAQGSIMNLPFEVEFSYGTFEHQAELHWVSPCCHHRGSITWTSHPVGSYVPCVSCLKIAGVCFSSYPYALVSVGSFWENNSARYTPDMEYTAEAKEWLHAYLNSEGTSPLAVEVATENLLEDIVRRLQALPVPAGTQDPAGWP